MEISKSQSKKTIGIYLLITFSLSSVVWALTFDSMPGRVGDRMFGYAIMWCPALATYFTCKVMKFKISGLAWKWGESKYIVWCYLIPLIYSLIAYLIIWFTGWGGFYNKEFISETAQSLGWSKLPDGFFIVAFFIATAITGIVGSMGTALGEEIGWRGFLTPHLKNVTNYTYTSLIVGAIWAVWHYPLIIFGQYNNGASPYYGMACFTVSVVSATFIYTWFRLKSKSLWTGVMLHASHNLFIQAIFTPLTIVNSRSKYFIDEFGATLAVVSIITALYFWTRRGEVQESEDLSAMAG